MQERTETGVPVPMDQTETPAPGEAPIMRPLGAGDPAPTFMLPDPDGCDDFLGRVARLTSPARSCSRSQTDTGYTWRKLMSEAERFEVLILGSGEGGKKVAWHMARSGRRTAVVERRWIGGSCPNIACLPSKNEIWSARVAHLTQHAAQFGTMISGPVTTDMAKVRQRKRNMVEGEIALHLHLYQTTGGELIMGIGRFVAPKTLEVRLNDGGTR